MEKAFKWFSFLSLLVGVAIVLYGAPYLEPQLGNIYPAGAKVVYRLVLFIGWVSVLFGAYSIFSFFGFLLKKIQKRNDRSCYEKKVELYLK